MHVSEKVSHPLTSMDETPLFFKSIPTLDAHTHLL